MGARNQRSETISTEYANFNIHILEQGKLRTENPCKIAQKTAFEEKGRQNTAGKVIQRLFNIDL